MAAEGPFGFPMSDAAASAIDAVLKSQPAGDEYRSLSRIVVKAVNDGFSVGERADISIIATAAPDREREVVLPAGLNLKHFEANPVVTWNHDYKRAPIGRSQWIKYDSRRDVVKAKTEYAKRPDDYVGEWFPDEVWGLVKQGMLQGKSIGFLPLEMRAPTMDEIREKGWGKVDRVHLRGIMLEYAVCPIQMNPDALVEAVAKGVVSRSFAEELLPEPPPPPELDPSKFKGRIIRPSLVTKAMVDARVNAKLASLLTSDRIDAMVRDRIAVAKGKV